MSCLRCCPHSGINKYDLTMTMSHVQCHGAVARTARGQERLSDGEALEMRFDQHGLARRMVTKEKNRLAPKPRSFTKRCSVPKAPLP